jgi:hypothetical protein
LLVVVQLGYYRFLAETTSVSLKENSVFRLRKFCFPPKENSVFLPEKTLF